MNELLVIVGMFVATFIATWIVHVVLRRRASL